MATDATGGLSAFMTEGAKIPAGSAVKSMTSQTVLPEWYTGYAMDILANQRAIGSTPMSPYQAPRVAGFTPTQQQGFDMTTQAAGAYQPGLSAATQGVQSVLGGPGGLATAQPALTAAMSGTAGVMGAPGGLSAAQPWLNQSAGVQSNAMRMGGGLPAATGYLESAAAINPLASAQPYYDRAGNLITQGTVAGGLNAATPWLNQAGGIDATASAQPYFSNAINQASSAVASGGGLAAAQPYLNASFGPTTDVSQYMDPYIGSVVDRVGELGARTLRERMLPEINDRYISAGQWGGSGQSTETARALRDISADVSAQQSQLLSQGYQNAVQAALADKARYGTLGATAGSLGSDLMRGGLDAAGLGVNVGAQLGSLTQGRQNALSNIGATFGNLGSQQQQALLEAAGLSANLGTAAGGLEQSRAALLSSIGQTAGSLASGDQRTMADIGKNFGDLGMAAGNLTNADRTFGLNAAGQMGELGVAAGNLTNTDRASTLTASGQMGGLAQLAQSLGLTGAGAVGSVGGQQQALDQRNLDVAYEDYLRQAGYPQEQINAMLAAFKGVSAGIPTASTEQGITPSGVQPEYKPGTAAQIASALAGAGGLVSAIGKL